MSKPTILFSDNLHFHERNFKSLFDYIKLEKIAHAFMTPKKPLLSAFGNYYAFLEDIGGYKFHIDGLGVAELLEYTYKGVPVFAVCKAELLSYLMPKYNWRNEQIFNIDSKIMEKAHSENYEDLINNMAAVCYWIDFWSIELKRFKVHDYCCIFSGSNIYSKALLELLKKHQTKPLVLESFFTGNDYYMEFKYDSLPNNSDIQYRNVFNSYHLPESNYEYNKARAKMINKILGANNKNVKQPSVVDGSFGMLPKNYLLICGQVLNDYSILNTQDQLNSLSTYKELIDLILAHTDYNIVFKAHPWEEKKNNIRFPLTYHELSEHIKKMPESMSSRVYITNHINLGELIIRSRGFITICSQSAFEAAFKGFKPIIIGGAFYDSYGFTSNFSSPKDFIQNLNSEEISFKLSLHEYDNFEKYLMVVLMCHLVCSFPLGIPRIREILQKPSFIPIQSVDENQTIVLDNSNLEPQTEPHVSSDKNVAIMSLQESLEFTI